MKKIIVAILAVLYLSTSIGATVHLHYCMGRLVDWGLWHTNSSRCSTCGMEKKHGSNDNGCCRDEHKQLKVEKDQKLSESFLQSGRIAAELTAVPVSVYSFLLPVAVTQEFSKSNAPP